MGEQRVAGSRSARARPWQGKLGMVFWRSLAPTLSCKGNGSLVPSSFCGGGLARRPSSFLGQKTLFLLRCRARCLAKQLFLQFLQFSQLSFFCPSVPGALGKK